MNRGERRPSEPLEVVAQGESEAVVFKPAGLSSERPAAERALLDSLIVRARAQFRWPEARLPHRLDRPTRGLVVISRDAAAAARHAAEIRDGAWTKWYIARIPSHGAGGAARTAGQLVGPHKAYLRREGTRAEVVRSGGDPSRLTVLATATATDRPDESHALILLETGRFHQIRAMLANLGFPLVGDALYGGRPRRGAATRGERGSDQRSNQGSDRGGDGDIDLEAIALRIARDGTSTKHRLRAHPARIGVDESIERALDAALDT